MDDKFRPDIEAIYRSCDRLAISYSKSAIKMAITSYEDQLTDAGYVIVRREDLKEVLAYTPKSLVSLADAKGRLRERMRS